jgi:hypothetical protein
VEKTVARKVMKYVQRVACGVLAVGGGEDGGEKGGKRCVLCVVDSVGSHGTWATSYGLA